MQNYTFEQVNLFVRCASRRIAREDAKTMLNTAGAVAVAVPVAFTGDISPLKELARALNSTESGASGTINELKRRIRAAVKERG